MASVSCPVCQNIRMSVGSSGSWPARRIEPLRSTGLPNPGRECPGASPSPHRGPVIRPAASRNPVAAPLALTRRVICRRVARY
jgi:hypothetical protein